MPKITGGVSSKTGRCWNESYAPHKITVGGLNATIKASSWQDRKRNKGGWNGAAVQTRIDYMRRALNIGLVDIDCIQMALETIKNLENQLCEE